MNFKATKMGRWSDWYPLTRDGIDEYARDESGVYEIALSNYVVKYPKGRSNIVYIGSAPFRTLRERLTDHLAGRGNPCVHHLSRKCSLMFSDMTPDSPYDTEQNAIDEFVRRFGDLPKCNEQ
jgi:hypothetical protein